MFYEIAQALYLNVKFIGAKVGCEVGGEDVIRTPEGVPETRWCGHVVPDRGALLGFPPTVQSAPISFDPPS